MRRMWIPQLVVSGILLWALSPANPYSYYILLRWVCCAVFAFLAVRAFAIGKQGWVWVLGVTTAIYNPLVPVHLTREIWSVINVVTIGMAITSIFAQKPKEGRSLALRSPITGTTTLRHTLLRLVSDETTIDERQKAASGIGRRSVVIGCVICYERDDSDLLSG